MSEKKKPRNPNFGKITDEEAEKLRSRIGVPRKQSTMHRAGTWTLTEDLIRRYTNGIGDDNPIFSDQEYGAKTRWGSMLINPAIMGYLERANGATDGFPGCHTIWRSAEYEWHLPLRLGMILDSTTYLRDVQIKEGEFSGRSAIQNYETEIIDVDTREAVGKYFTSWHRFERKKAADKQKLKKKEKRELATYTKEQVAEIRQGYLEESRRGSETLFYEDVEVGKETPKITKGPTTVTSKFAFESLRGAGGWLVGHKLAFKLYDEHPGLPFINEQGIPEPPVAIHWSNERSQRYLGLPGAYEAGYERTAWICQQIADWMGDDGFLRRLTQKFPTFSLLGDTTWCHSKVVAKEEKGAVRLEVWTVNQQGDVTTTGEAEVVLPLRGGSG